MSWRQEQLPELVRAIAARPRHEALRGYVTELLRLGFEAPCSEIEHEVYLLDRSGRIDTMWGAVVIELKNDLRREIGDVLARLPAYMADASARSRSPRPVIGLATDGATFIAYALNAGSLQETARYETDPERPDELMAWLEPLLSDRPELLPERRAIAQAFGRASVTFGQARLTLESLWTTLGNDPEVRLKRELWDGLLSEAYGESVGEDALFLQHTYLTIIVKAIAARVLDLPVSDPAALLSGRAFAEEGILGAVEADFFDWPLKLTAGEDLVRQIAAQVERFRLRDVETDVLKILYESLVDPDQRHDLGEYYTPDWLAARVVRAAIDAPLRQRVLDPACGSGTFLFHAVRRLIAEGRAEGWSPQRILAACEHNVRGLDVHPVAVTLARVTWLLALGDLVTHRADRLTVPVFLGDAMQWNLRRYVGGADVVVDVPGDRPLQIPQGFAEDQAVFESGLDMLHQGLEDDATPESVGRALRTIEGASAADADVLAATYEHLQALYRAGRDGIWIFIFRNLVRPVWLSRTEQRADVLVGNPPWIAYRHLSAAMKDRLRQALGSYDLWVGGNLATQQDICALFWARAADRYLAPEGRLAFVLPYAVLNAPVFAGLRSGRMGSVTVAPTGAWALERAWPIFGAQSGSSTTSTCVLFGRRDSTAVHPAEIDRWQGQLSRRDANDGEAAHALRHSRIAWPRVRTLVGLSPYRARFRQGAAIVPRRFFVVEPDTTSRLGARRDAPRMRGRTGPLDKRPWNTVEPPRGPVEAAFLRQLILGESIAPYRLLDTVTAVIPMAGSALLDSKMAAEAGHRHLAGWLRDVEAKWAEHSNKDLAGRPRMTLIEQIDHMRKLSCQSGSPAVRVLYTKAGTRLSAARVASADGVVDHKAYWAAARSSDEAGYLIAVINSAAVLAKIVDLQPHGQRDKRDFDNLVWTLPIPEYDDTDPLHRDLAAAASRAEEIARLVDLSEARHFTAKRRAIRDALVAAGVAQEIEAMVDALLPP
ncbi:MAG TPA: N-6 DNA methylase [Stellaceae bacterium]|nr:N-6 DNA methylase [Stellaceae bacterium]